jgi:hypothetical protein
MMRGLAPYAFIIAMVVLMLATGCSVMKTMFETEPQTETDSEKPLPWPKVPLGSPDSTCLLIVDCHVTYRGNAGRLDKAWLKALGDEMYGKPDALPVGGVLIDAEGNRHMGASLGPGICEGLLLFPDLPSGSYRLWRIESSYYLGDDEKRETYHIDSKETYGYPDELFFKHILMPEQNDNVTFSIDEGEFLYFGKMVIDEKHNAPFGDRKLRESPPPHIRWQNARWEVDRHTCHLKQDQWQLIEADENEIAALRNLSAWYGLCPWRARWRQRMNVLSAKAK